MLVAVDDPVREPVPVGLVVTEPLGDNACVRVTAEDLVPVGLTVTVPLGENACEGVPLGVAALDELLLRVIPAVKLAVCV